MGYGAAFIHGLGHGIGLQIHEHPFLKTSHDPLEAGMAFTLEPGIYLPGEIGIRIEDDYHLTDAGLAPLDRRIAGDHRHLKRPRGSNRLIDTGDVKKGVIIELDGQLHEGAGLDPHQDGARDPPRSA